MPGGITGLAGGREVRTARHHMDGAGSGSLQQPRVSVVQFQGVYGVLVVQPPCGRLLWFMVCWWFRRLLYMQHNNCISHRSVQFRGSVRRYYL